MMTQKLSRLVGGAVLGLASALSLFADSTAPQATTRVEVIHTGNQTAPRAVGAGEHTFVFTSATDEDTLSGPVTFLGVETSGASATLTEQLGLTPGMGLVVQRVLPESAAEKVLKRHDVLTRFEDQWLVSAEQLGVLVRAKAAGTKVALTLVRGGKEQVVTVELGERKAPAMRRIEFRGRTDGEEGARLGQIDRLRQKMKDLHGVGEMSRGDVDHLMDKLKTDGSRGMTWVEAEDGTSPGPVVRMLESNRGNVIYSDEAGTVELKSGEGGKVLVVKGGDGKVAFEGPVNTDEERAALADPIKQRLEKVEGIRHLELHTSDGFETDELRVLQAGTPSAQMEVAPVRGTEVVADAAL